MPTEKSLSQKITTTLDATYPGPKPIISPLFNMLRFFKSPVFVAQNLFERYGPVVGTTGGSYINDQNRSSHLVLVGSSQLSQQILTSPAIYHKFPYNQTFYDENTDADHPRKRLLKHFGTGLFAVQEDEHRSHRRLMMPAFHNQRLSVYGDEIVHETEMMMRSWDIGHVRNIHEEMIQLTLKIVANTLFGGVTIDSEKIGHLAYEAIQLVTNPLTIGLQLDVRGTPYHRFINVVAEATDAVREVIASKRQDALDDSVLSLLINSTYMDEHGKNTGERMTEDELLGHVILLFAAGHETSSHALTWALILLSQFPDIFRSVVHELDEKLSGNPPTMDDLEDLHMLDCVIKEVLRLFPAIPMNSRITARDTELGAYAFPAGTRLAMSLYHIHRDADVYDEPLKFKPERWQHIKPSAYEYMPFSAGPRTCIGYNFAQLELKLILARLLQDIRFEAIPDTTIAPTGMPTMGPKHGFPLKIQARDGKYDIGVGGMRGPIHQMVELPS